MRAPASFTALLVVSLLAGAGGGVGPGVGPGAGAGPRAGAAPTDAWVWPIGPPHTISAAYDAPATPYAAGHRGLDFAARPGDPVLAPADGVVSFVGVVVDRPVLAIAHPGDRVSSFEPVEASVAVGDPVLAGQRIGTVATGGHCQGCLHLGLRLHGEYVSPLLLLGGIPGAVLLPLA
ncbi:M23 family metallopeptidase [Cryobacterium melibiosiphilum]|uniref:M23 family metallopeptidase n=1 Tax=Cryobacterium melibiosiphilum TaxID=995039 RepID=A0A3A5MDI1_9MICO|nr:peptidoglycan DD-metalloendopeptidase family protein [Cryobacterium melibiosiphilum]RJT84657.1 M23 family metallopeptidase [Cryobacterium melibiosiphilum]